MLLNIVFIIIGFVLLVKGGDYLVDGSVAIARRAKLSPMVIGLTVIGFGTSAPELLVSAQASLAGSSGIAIGNVVGSNIANIALILGVTSLICPIPSKRATLRIDMPFMVIAMAMFIAAAMTGTIERWQGLIFVACIAGFVTWQVMKSRKEISAQDSAEEQEKPMPVWKALLMVVVSIGAMVWGANKLIEGASGIAMDLGTQFGIEPSTMERIIGLTIVAVGTSLPELFASVIAARKGETDMAIGNIIGSVTFNILCVIGISSTICPIVNSDKGFLFDYILMGGLGLLLWAFLATKHKLERWEGAVLLTIYILFIARTVIMTS
ncbi:MAG: calcium/sodium antiporter [Prevotellaceae bacterium]|nr:calcium/sodium antiporter [Candidatus Minthosoma caballi]